MLSGDSMRKYNQSFSLKVFPHFVVNLLLCLSLLIMASIVCILLSRESNTACLIFMIVIPICVVAWILWSNICGWNAVVIFDKTKITQRRGLKKCVFYWDDICGVTCRTHRPFFLKNALMYAPKFKFYFNDKKAKLAVVLPQQCIKRIMEICPSEKIVAEIKRLYEECDYSFE